MKKQHYMSHDEQQKLEALHRAKVPVGQIAQQLGFCRQTIYNELHRGAYLHEVDGFLKRRYSPERSKQLRAYAQTAKGRPLKIGHDKALADFLEQKMLGVQEDGSTDRQRRFSPAAALAAARKEGFATSVCIATLYSYIDKELFLHVSNKDLWEKSKKKKRKKRVQRIAHPQLPSIAERPWHINARQDIGHWEMDLIVGKARSRAVLLTLTERITRQELIFKLPNKKAASVCAVFNRLERSCPDFKQRFQSLTTDNGVEFMEYDKLCRSIHGGKRFDVWYCHSFAAWEKGANENQNRMIRRFFPKGTDFTSVSEKRIDEVERWMNQYPRKVLGWCAPAEVA